jgi:hypothetical protein
MKALGFSK